MRRVFHSLKTATASGAFARIHAALDVADDRCVQVAVKILLEPHEYHRQLPLVAGSTTLFPTYADARACFDRERRLWANLGDHPNVVKAYGERRSGGEPTLVLQYVHGPTLRELVESERLPFLDVVDVLRQGALSLSFLHGGRRVVHGDLLPANLLFDGCGRIKLADFGLAHRVGATLTAAEARQNLPPPERGRTRLATPAGDVWRLGVCAAQAALGAAPFFRCVRGRHVRIPALMAGLANLRNEWSSVPDSALRGLVAEFEALLNPDPTSRPEDGPALRLRLEAPDHPLAEVFRALARRDELRRSVYTPAGGETAGESLGRIGDAIHALGRVEARWSWEGGVQPDTDHAVARGAWRAFCHHEGRERELAGLALRHATDSRSAYPRDERVFGLLVAAGDACLPAGRRAAFLLDRCCSEWRLQQESPTFLRGALLARSAGELLGSAARAGRAQGRVLVEATRRQLASAGFDALDRLVGLPELRWLEAPDAAASYPGERAPVLLPFSQSETGG